MFSPSVVIASSGVVAFTHTLVAADLAPIGGAGNIGFFIGEGGSVVPSTINGFTIRALVTDNQQDIFFTALEGLTVPNEDATFVSMTINGIFEGNPAPDEVIYQRVDATYSPNQPGGGTIWTWFPSIPTFIIGNTYLINWI